VPRPLGVTGMRDDYRLQEQVAVVTGAGRGIGLSIARELGQAGATVVVADINAELGQQAVRDLGSAGITAISVPVDVANAASVGAMTDAVI